MEFAELLGKDVYIVYIRKTKRKQSGLLRSIFCLASSPEVAIQGVIAGDKKDGSFNPENGYFAEIFYEITITPCFSFKTHIPQSAQRRRK